MCESDILEVCECGAGKKIALSKKQHCVCSIFQFNRKKSVVQEKKLRYQKNNTVCVQFSNSTEKKDTTVVYYIVPA